MTQNTETGLKRVVLNGVLFAGLLVGSLHAAEPARKSITSGVLWQNGVSGMFRLSENRDSSVCEPLLASINKHVEHPSLPVVSLSEPRWKISKPLPFLLLRNGFLIDPWRYQNYFGQPRSTDPKTVETWEVAYLDLDGDGSPDALFRSTGMTSEGSHNDSSIFRSVDPRTAAADIVDGSLARRIRRDSKVYLSDFGTAGNAYQFLELVRIGDRPYAIIASANFWTLKDRPRRPRVQLLKFTPTGVERVCLFDGQIEIISR